jgi:hypothetical protein
LSFLGQMIGHPFDRWQINQVCFSGDHHRIPSGCLNNSRSLDLWCPGDLAPTSLSETGVETSLTVAICSFSDLFIIICACQAPVDRPD